MLTKKEKKLNINDLPEPEAVKTLYTTYYRSHDSDGSGIEVSSHWRELMALCRIEIEDDGTVAAMQGLGFGDLEFTRPWHRLTNVLCIRSYLRTMDRKRIPEVIKLMRLSKPVLQSFGIPMSYDCFRQLCSLADIKRHLDAEGVVPQRVMAIGDGYGFLSSMIKTLWPSCTIAFIDNGPVLLFQAINMQRIFPGARHAFVGKSAGKGASSGFDFWYCPAELRDSLSLRDFSLIINISSMNEMTIGMIKEYFSYIRSRSDKQNYFYCCNRHEKVLVGGERTAFSEYPWEKGDKIYFDEKPDFYRYYYSCRYPFKHYFEPFQHRLVRMKTS